MSLTEQFVPIRYEELKTPRTFLWASGPAWRVAADVASHYIDTHQMGGAGVPIAQCLLSRVIDHARICSGPQNKMHQVEDEDIAILRNLIVYFRPYDEIAPQVEKARKIVNACDRAKPKATFYQTH